MKITRKVKDNTTTFSTLGCGAIFTPADVDDEGEIFLRVEDIHNNDEEHYNAIHMDSGEFIYFTPLCPVIRISAELIVEY